MSDYCMCEGDGCPKKGSCFRFRAIPDKYRQSYFEIPPVCGDICKFFMTIEGWSERMLTPGKTTVVNRRTEAYDVFIGRGSKWGNPFIIGESGGRQAVLEKYRVWIQRRSDLLDDLPELVGKRLGCYCKPKACHGDILVELLQERGLIAS